MDSAENPEAGATATGPGLAVRRPWLAARSCAWP